VLKEDALPSCGEHRERWLQSPRRRHWCGGGGSGGLSSSSIASRSAAAIARAAVMVPVPVASLQPLPPCRCRRVAAGVPPALTRSSQPGVRTVCAPCHARSARASSNLDSSLVLTQVRSAQCGLWPGLPIARCVPAHGTYICMVNHAIGNGCMTACCDVRR